MDDNGDDQSTRSIRYRRRLDRTPDKNFETLPRNEKMLLSTLRTSLEQAKSRIVRLRDENEEKDDIIDEERKLRRAAEERLEKYLVDLYNNPDVNVELRQRLPRAKKGDPLRQDLENDSSSGCLATVTLHVSDDNSESQELPDMGRENKNATDNMEKNSVMRSHRGDVVKGNMQPVVSVSVDNTESPRQAAHQQTTQQPNIPNGFHSPAKEPFAVESSSNSFATITPGLSAPPAHIAQWLPPYIHPSVYANPLSSASWSSLDSSSYHGLPAIHKPGVTETGDDVLHDKKDKHSGLGHDRDPKRTSGLSVTDESPHVTFNISQGTVSSTSSVPPPSYHSKAHSGQQTIIPPQLPPYPSLSYGPYSFRAYYGTDNVSHISRLLSEIAMLKKENAELKEKLKDAKRDIELLKIDTSVGEDSQLDKLGALIEEVRTAERKRDKAVKMILEAADLDKSAALGELDRIKLKRSGRSGLARSLSDSELTDVDNNADDEDDDSLASFVSESDSNGKRKKISSHEYLEQLVARQREIMKEEMQKVIDQRNEAKARAMKLEKKLSEMELSQFSNKQADTLLAKLRVTEKERDMLMARLKFLTQDVNETKLVYNLHKALMSEDPANDASSYNGYHDDKLNNLDLASDLSKNNPMTARLSQQSEEKEELEKRVGKLEKEKKAAAQQIEKLEQLVQRQRHKLNTLCAGPMLVDSE